MMSDYDDDRPSTRVFAYVCVCVCVCVYVRVCIVVWNGALVQRTSNPEYNLWIIHQGEWFPYNGFWWIYTNKASIQARARTRTHGHTLDDNNNTHLYF